MSAPRDIGCARLVNALSVLGYEATRQNSSHVRVTTLKDDENHEVIPCDPSIRPGILSGILKHVAAHHRMSVNDLLVMLSL
jgi:predicted RNA binding protein YcfA (HicA-like mRNA interferase family)